MAGEWVTKFIDPKAVLDENWRVRGAIYVNGCVLVEEGEAGIVQNATDWATRETGGNNGASYVEKYLQYLLGEPRIKLLHIVVLQCYGYEEKEYGYVVE